MNTSQGALHFSAGIDLTQWRRDMDTMRRDIFGLSRDTQNQTRNMDSAFKNLSMGIAGYFSVGAIKNFVTELINVRGEFQKTEIAFSTMLKSEGKAAALMGEMVDLAANTPFSLQEVSAGAKQLLAFQIPANQVVDTLTRMGNIAAGLGVPLSRINLVYGQVKAKGKLMGDDLRQFTEAGIPMVAELAKKFNTTTGAITEMVSAGKIGFKDVQDVLFNMTNEGGMFFNLMEKQSKSLSGQVSNLGDTWDQMLNKIGEGQQGILTDGIQGLTYLVEHYEDVGKAILTLIEIYGAYRAALIFTSALQTRIAAPAIIQGFANLIKMIRGATVAQTALNTASLANPYVLLGTAIVALIAVVYNYKTELGELIGIIEEHSVAQKAQQAVTESYNNSFGKGVAATKANISQLIAIIRNESSSLEQRKQAYERLIAIDPEFRGTLDAQYKSTFRLGNALEFVIGKIDAFAMAQAKAAASRKVLEESFEESFKAGGLKTQVMDADEEAKKWRKLDEEARKAGKASLDYNRKAFAAEQKRDALAEKWREQQNTANSKTALSNAIIRNNNKEISQKEKQLQLLEKEIKLGKMNGEALQLKKKQADKLRYELSGFKPEVITEEETAPAAGSKKGTQRWYEEEVQRLEEANKNLVPQTKQWIANHALIEKYNKIINYNKAKPDNRQLAEIFPDGSVKKLEQDAQLITDALQRVENGVVKLRKLDKYGNDKDDKGNTLYTGEKVTKEEAMRRLAEINARLAAKRREIDVKTFEEDIIETKRQIEIRDKLLKSGYSKETTDEMFPKVKDLTFIQYLNNLGKSLETVKGIDAAENLIKLKSVLSEYTGEATFIEKINKQIDEFKSKFKGDELVDKLEAFKNENDEGTTGDEVNTKNILVRKAQDDELERQKTAYRNLLEENRSFAQRKIQIEKETADAIKKINSDANLTPEQKKFSAGSVDKKSKEEISQLAVDELTQSQAWMSLYGNIDELTAYQMQVLLEQLEAQKGNLVNVLTPVDFKVVLKNLKETKQQISDENPFLGLLSSVKDLFSAFGNESEEAGEKAFSSFERASDGIKGTLKATKGIISALAPAREYMSDAANDAIDTIDQVATMGMMMMQAIDSTVTAVKSALDNASWSNWITAIISIIYTVIRAVVSLFTWIAGNKRKKLEKEIKGLQGTLDSLEETYTNLAIAAEKAFGAMKYEGQRELIRNLQEQQKVLEDMKNTESKKKKADQDKINDYNKQQQDNLRKIQEIKDAIIRDVLQVDVVEMAANIGDALIEAFGKGVDGIDNINKAFDEMIKNIMRNQLNKVLEAQMAPIYDNILKAAGFDKDGNGTFNGLTKDEIDDLRAQVLAASTKGKEFIDAYSEIFKDLDMSSPEGIKGSIKGMTEKTAGALEAQFNAMRINFAEAVKYSKINNTIAAAQNAILSQIEVNTRRLHTIDKTLTEMNSKMKKSLAGVP
ncbi:tape measure protein [Chryseobacterium mulctrae]|uniref:tape measure protein n=1 Tax=Chryseobacterium mulctrae TaxID=2576777 RepID=UPI0011169E3E|nr:tape measure protein [Chryseobacterium mulctrae]